MNQNRKEIELFRKRLFYNLIAGVIAYGIISCSFIYIKGYNWVYKGLLTGNYKFAREHKHVSADERRAIKLGTSFTYLEYLKRNSPENAVILMPEKGAYNPEGREKFFDHEIHNKLFRLRVLYPRKIVDADEQINKYVKQITHIAIVNGYGYQWIDMEMDEKPFFAIFPVKH